MGRSVLLGRRRTKRRCGDTQIRCVLHRVCALLSILRDRIIPADPSPSRPSPSPCPWTDTCPPTYLGRFVLWYQVQSTRLSRPTVEQYVTPSLGFNTLTSLGKVSRPCTRASALSSLCGREEWAESSQPSGSVASLRHPLEAFPYCSDLSAHHLPHHSPSTSCTSQAAAFPHLTDTIYIPDVSATKSEKGSIPCAAMACQSTVLGCKLCCLQEGSASVLVCLTAGGVQIWDPVEGQRLASIAVSLYLVPPSPPHTWTAPSA